MPVFQYRKDEAGRFAVFTAFTVLTIIAAAAFLSSCAKVDPIDQNHNDRILIDEPISVPATDPVIVTNDAVPNTVTNEAINQVEASEQPR